MHSCAGTGLGARLRELRTGRGLSLQALAALALSSRSHIHNFETGQAIPKADTLARLDAALDAGGSLVAMLAVARPDGRSGSAPSATAVDSAGVGVAAGQAEDRWPAVQVVIAAGATVTIALGEHGAAVGRPVRVLIDAPGADPADLAAIVVDATTVADGARVHSLDTARRSRAGQAG